MNTHSLCGDNVALLLLVEAGNALQGHVIRLSCARGEYDVFWIRADEVCKMLEDIMNIKSLGRRSAEQTLRESSIACSASQP